MQELALSKVNGFFENHFKEVVARLHPGLRPLWGQMTPQHVIEHLTWTLTAASNQTPFNVYTPEEKLSKYRQFLFNNMGIVHNYKSPVMEKDKPPVLKHPDWETALQEFWMAWDAFEDFFKKNPTAITNNAVFGPLTNEEWRRFHFKHFVHHFSQFGVTSNTAHGLEEPPQAN